MKLSPEAEREWQRQERALQQEREGLPDDGDAGTRAYRLLARSLAEPMAVELAPDFARSLALRAERARLLDGRVEQLALTACLALFALLAGYALFVQGGEWLAQLRALVPALDGGGARWLLLALACAGLSYWPRSVVLPARSPSA